MDSMIAIIPFVFMGIGLKIAGPHLKNKNDTFLFTGMGFGVGIGLLVSNYIPAIPASYGVSLGFLVGVLIGSNIKKPKK